MLINDNLKSYEGEGYEKVFLHNYKAINYLILGSCEDARVEIKNSYRKQIEERKKFNNEIKKLQEEKKKKEEKDNTQRDRNTEKALIEIIEIMEILRPSRKQPKKHSIKIF